MVLDQAVTTVIFDFDGTLFHLPVDAAALRIDLGLTPDESIGDAIQTFMDTDDDRRLGVVTEHERAAVIAGEPTPGALAVLDKLSGSVNLAVLTRNSRTAVLEALGEHARSMLVVGREDVRRLKPDPEGARRIMTHFGAAPAECVLVGDTFHDVRAAGAAGIGSIVVSNPRLAFRPREADSYIDSLAELVELVEAGRGPGT